MENNSDASILAAIQYGAYLYRGQVINDSIYLEVLINEALKRHFSKEPDKQQELFELILGNERMNFMGKVQVFEYILGKHYPEFIQKHSKLLPSIKNRIITERNIVAHYLLNTSSEGKQAFLEEKKFGFVKFRNSTETLWRTQESYQEFHDLQTELITIMNEFLSM